LKTVGFQLDWLGAEQVLIFIKEKMFILLV